MLEAGLDSFAALSIVAYLKAMAGAGHTLVVSIHQPRSAIWSMFDKVRPRIFYGAEIVCTRLYLLWSHLSSRDLQLVSPS